MRARPQQAADALILLNVRDIPKLDRDPLQCILAAALVQDLVASCLEYDEMPQEQQLSESIMQTVNCRFRARSAPGPILLRPDSLFLSDKHLCESTQPTDQVHIICKRLVEYWGLEVVPPKSASALGKLFGFISPSIVKSVLKFKRIVEVNCNVHLPTYSSIIAEEARKKKLAQ